MDNRRRALATLIGVFLLGLILGLGGTLAWVRRDLPAWPIAFRGSGGRNHFSEMLSLTPEQDKQIKAIFDETRRQTEELRKEIDPKFDAIRAQANSRIAALLSDEQKKKFEQFLKERDSSRNRNPRGDDRNSHGPSPH
jgi:Spy/CpxP family protein refolding chaperone